MKRVTKFSCVSSSFTGSTMTENINPNIPAARRKIARIRCLQDCINCLQTRKPFPDCLCYVPSQLEYTATCKTTFKFLEEPRKGSKVVKEVAVTPSTSLLVSGEDLCTDEGKWLRVMKVCKLDVDRNRAGEILKSCQRFCFHVYCYRSFFTFTQN